MKREARNDKRFHKIQKLLDRKPEIIIIHVTDTYFLEETLINKNVDLPGFARFYSLIDYIRSNRVVQKNNIPVFVLHGGDFLFPSLMSVYFRGKQMIDILNTCRFNCCTLGNHDFDDGIKLLKTRMSEASFDIICANIKPSNKDDISLPISKFKIFQNKNNQPFAAITGIAGKTTLRNAKQNEFDIFTAESSLKQVINTIKQISPEIKHLIVLSHMSNKEDINLEKWLARNWEDYVYLLGGHDHNRFLQYEDKNSKSILLKGQSNCRTVQIVGITNKIESGDADQLTKYVVVVDSTEMSQINPNTKIQKLVSKWELLLERYLKETELDITIKQFKANTILDATELELRKGSTNFGNFIADCMLEYTNSDIAFINSGHFRGDRKIGNCLKMSDLRRIFVLDSKDALVKITMTCKECKEFLIHAYSEEGRGKILQVSKNTIKILQKSLPDDKFSVVMLWDMLRTKDDGFSTILAKSRKISVSKLETEIKNYIIQNSSLFEVVKKSSKNIEIDSEIRVSVKNFTSYF